MTDSASSSRVAGDVLILYTGGTIGSRPRDADNPESPQVVVPWDDVRAGMPALDRLASRRGWRIDCVPSRQALDSCNIGPQQWVEYARIIQARYADFNGFVILHGTDTMVYTASALSFMLRGLAKPVVLTGAQRSELVDVRNDASQNLLTSIEIANGVRAGHRVPGEVMIYFGGLLLRGNRAVKRATSGYVAYESPNFAPIAVVGDQVQVRDVPATSSESFLLRPRLDSRVLPIFIFPGVSAEIVRGQIRAVEGLKAVVVQAFGSGNIPTLDPAFLSVFKDARKEGIMVVVVTQCRHGPVELGIYETSAALLDAGFVAAHDITVEAAQCKLMSLFGDPDITVEVAEAEFQRAIAGEQSVSTFVTPISGEGALGTDGTVEARIRLPAKVLVGHWGPRSTLRALLRFRDSDLAVEESALFSMFVDLDAETEASPSHPGFCGAARKWAANGLVIFDVTRGFRAMAKVGGRSSFSLALSKGTAARLSWSSVDLAVHVDES